MRSQRAAYLLDTRFGRQPVHLVRVPWQKIVRTDQTRDNFGNVTQMKVYDYSSATTPAPTFDQDVLSMQIPILNVKLQNDPLMPQLRQAFERVMISGRYILGPEVELFESRCAAVAGVKHGIGVSSGTDAILLALMALDIGPGDEVICPSFTFFATAGCIARTGARPVFADSLAGSFNIDIEDARKKVTSRTKAIIPVHLFGQMAEMDAVMEFARAYGLRVLEDAAQSMGAGYRGNPAGSFGDFGTFSFYPSKNLGGFGDSGMLVTNDDTLAEKARLLRTHGEEGNYFHKMVGANFRIDPLQAALLNVKLDYLEAYSNKRAENSSYYSRQLQQFHSNHLLLPIAGAHCRHIWNQYTLRVLSGRRDSLKDFLASRQIESGIYYPLPLHMQECFPPAGVGRPSLPVCERLANQCLSIPIYPELSEEQKDAVVAAITEMFTAQTTIPGERTERAKQG